MITDALLATVYYQMMVLLYININKSMWCKLFRHARDIRVHYEQKLERANSLYQELNECMQHLEAREKELLRLGGKENSISVETELIKYRGK